MTLNDLERRNSPYFAFFSPNSTDFQADYITVVDDRPIMSVKCKSPSLQSSTFGENYNAPCSAVSLRWLSILLKLIAHKFRALSFLILSPKIALNTQFQAKVPKYKNRNISETINPINTKFEDQVETNNCTSWVGGLILPRSNPIRLPAAIRKNQYDVITPQRVVRFWRNLVGRCTIKRAWSRLGQNRNRKENSNMAAVRFSSSASPPTYPITVLLDLSAAIDTVDHNILLTVLSSRFGVAGTAYDWFESYLSGRT